MKTKKEKSKAIVKKDEQNGLWNTIYPNGTELWFYTKRDAQAKADYYNATGKITTN